MTRAFLETSGYSHQIGFIVGITTKVEQKNLRPVWEASGKVADFKGFQVSSGCCTRGLSIAAITET
jgi:hypothetical protein